MPPEEGSCGESDEGCDVRTLSETGRLCKVEDFAESDGLNGFGLDVGARVIIIALCGKNVQFGLKGCGKSWTGDGGERGSPLEKEVRSRGLDDGNRSLLLVNKI
jgi:hypothetical protein